MEINKTNKEQYIDVSYILKALWRKAWIILTVTLLVGALVLAGTVLFVTPKYSASVIMYVNNNTIDLGSTISLSQLDAARDRVNSYLVILNTRTTLEQVIAETGVNYSYEDLQGMITAGPVNDTEFFAITVTSEDPYEAARIANKIDDVLAQRTENIIEGTIVRTVDDAVVNNKKVSPSLTMNTALGLLMGFVGSCSVFAVLAIMDDTIRDEEYILQTYDLPMLAKIPDLMAESDSSEYSYYNSYGSSKADGK